MSTTDLTGLPLPRLPEFVLRPGDAVDIDGALQDDGGTRVLLPLGDDDGPKAGEPVGHPVAVVLPAGSPCRTGDVVTVRGVWTGDAIVARWVSTAAVPRRLRRLTRGRVVGAPGPASESSQAREAMDHVVSSEIPKGLVVAFSSERRQDGSNLEMVWFTRLTPEIGHRFVAVPVEQFAVDVWLVPVREA